MGRPSSLKPEHIKLAKKVALLGATDVEIADVLGVDVRTLYRWRNQNDAFCQALTVGKEVADAKVEDSLYRRATGYSHPAVKIMACDGVVKHEQYTEHVPPDVTACIFWLKNRRPEAWRDQREHLVTRRDEVDALSPEAKRERAREIARKLGVVIQDDSLAQRPAEGTA